MTLVGGHGRSAELNSFVERCPGPLISGTVLAIVDRSPTEKLSMANKIVGVCSPQEFITRSP